MVQLIFSSPVPLSRPTGLPWWASLVYTPEEILAPVAKKEIYFSRDRITNNMASCDNINKI